MIDNLVMLVDERYYPDDGKISRYLPFFQMELKEQTNISVSHGKRKFRSNFEVDLAGNSKLKFVKKIKLFLRILRLNGLTYF